MPRARLSSGIELEYEVHGSGRPLLLVGGLGAQLISWDDELCEAFVSRGYEVIRYDNRDSGLSTTLDHHGVPDLLGLLMDGSTAPYSLDDMAADAIGLLDHLGLARVDVVGLSLGGMIAQLIALDHPNRVLSLVAALSGPPGRPAEIPAPIVVEALLRYPGHTFEEQLAGAVGLRHALAGGGAGFDFAEARRRAELQILRAHNPAGTMRQAAAVLASPNRLVDLRQITVPAMVIHGELDPLIPFTSAQAAAATIPNSTFVRVPALGHDVPQAVALDLIERIIRFHAETAAR